MDIRPLDLADHRALSAAYLLECSATQRVRPGWVPLGRDARILGWRAEHRWLTQLVGAWELGTLLGFASCMTAQDTADTTWINVSVDPGSQGSGVGSALVRAGEAAGPASTKRFVGSAYRPSPDAIETLLLRFAQPLGYAVATTETVVELDLRSTTLPAPIVADGYQVSTHLNGVPEELRAQVGRIKGLLDAEAPSGDLGWDETPVTPAEYATEIDLWVAQGRTAVESVVVDEHGSVVAWTCLVVADDPRRPAQVEGTLVVGPHRGRGLGTAVKLACLRRVQQLGTVSRVRTSSDDQNVWMRAINSDLGFTPVETELIVQKPRAAHAASPRHQSSG